MGALARVTIGQLEMTNFKRFYGRHVLDLSPLADVGKPIVLIGGDNGRGKTSIHEAINYALYEDDELPGIQTRPNYLKAVSDRLSRRALDEGASDFGVSLELFVQDGGPARRFRIERSWEVDPGARRATTTRLRVTENDRPIDWIDQDNPHAVRDFVRAMVPPRIAPFFFFDGERIQEFAEGHRHEHDLVEAIEDILHINVYKVLRSDLTTYVADWIEKNEVRKAESGDFFKLQEDLERIESELEAKRARRFDVERDIRELEVDRKRIGDELRRIASPHAPQRNELLLEQQRIEQELAIAKSEVAQSFEALPLLLSGTLVLKLRESLERDQGGLTTAAGLAELRQKLSRLSRRILYDPQPPPATGESLTPAQVVWLERVFAQGIEEIFDLRDRAGQTERIHDIGEGERQSILRRLGDVSARASTLRDAIDRRERLANELRDVELKLQSTSDDPAVAGLIRRKQEVDQQIGQLDNELKSLTAEVQKLETDFAARQRQLADRQKERQATTEAKRAVKLARQAQRVLDDFIKRLAPGKLAALQTRFNEMYGRIRKPEDPVHGVEVDPDTWEVVLKDSQGRSLERRVFSAGMKEMYALSLLWALAKASGRELPMVIDTPLGRLDSKNRESLCRHYFPHAGHQVVVLSTDKEVDQEWFGVLRPFVARQYRLDYDAALDSTVIRPGYFF